MYMPSDAAADIINQLHRKTATVTHIPLEDTIVLNLEIPFSEEAACVYYLDRSSNTCGILVSELPDSEALMADFSEVLKESVSNLSLPPYCRVKRLFLSPRDGGKIKLDLEYSIPQTLQNFIADLIKQTLTSRLRSNPNIWVSKLWTHLSNSNPTTFKYKLLTDDKENFYTQKIPTPEFSISEFEASQYHVTLPENISSNQIYELQYDRKTPEETIQRNLEKYVQTIVSEPMKNTQDYSFTKQLLSVTPRESTGKLGAELSIQL
jgi:hypothetical protein